MILIADVDFEYFEIDREACYIKRKHVLPRAFWHFQPS